MKKYMAILPWISSPHRVQWHAVSFWADRPYSRNWPVSYPWSQGQMPLLVVNELHSRHRSGGRRSPWNPLGRPQHRLRSNMNCVPGPSLWGPQWPHEWQQLEKNAEYWYLCSSVDIWKPYIIFTVDTIIKRYKRALDNLSEARSAFDRLNESAPPDYVDVWEASIQEAKLARFWKPSAMDVMQCHGFWRDWKLRMSSVFSTLSPFLDLTWWKNSYQTAGSECLISISLQHGFWVHSRWQRCQVLQTNWAATDMSATMSAIPRTVLVCRQCPPLKTPSWHFHLWWQSTSLHLWWNCVITNVVYTAQRLMTVSDMSRRNWVACPINTWTRSAKLQQPGRISDLTVALNCSVRKLVFINRFTIGIVGWLEGWMEYWNSATHSSIGAIAKSTLPSPMSMLKNKAKYAFTLVLGCREWLRWGSLKSKYYFW